MKSPALRLLTWTVAIAVAVYLLLAFAVVAVLSKPQRTFDAVSYTHLDVYKRQI